MATKRIDGSGAAESLRDRINIEDGVGSALALRTRDEYGKKINTISNHIRAADGGALTPTTLSHFLAASFSKGQIAQATARSQKAAALYWLAAEAESLVARDADISDYEAAYARIIALPTAQLPRRTGVTSSTKLKFFSKQALEDLTRYTETSTKALSAGTLLAFVRANLLVGLRPAEWFNASFATYLVKSDVSDSNFVLKPDGRLKSVLGLHVGNAKHTHGRANGVSRDILLHDVSPDDLSVIRHFHGIVRSFSSKYPKGTEVAEMAKDLFKPLQQTLRKALRRTNQNGASLPTVYSTRHQAVANCKASGMSDREIAAFFGHRSVSTAKTHYGKKAHGWSKTTFRPSPESVAAVMERSLASTNAEPSKRTRDESVAWIAPTL